MATLKLTLFKAKVLKDGRHKIRIAVCHKRETSYIVTNVIVDNESQFKNGQVVKRPDAAIMNKKLRNLLNEYQDILDSIKNQSVYDCKQLKNLILQKYGTSATPTFKEVAEVYIKELNGDGRRNYALLLDRNSRYFSEFVNGDIVVSDITPQLISNYTRFLRTRKKLGNTSVNMMLSHTKVIINKAINEYAVKFELHPFYGCKITSSPVREADISIGAFNRIRNSQPKERRCKVARDLFCLSFFLGGINLVDLLEVDFRKEKIEYVRTKSKNTTQGVRTISFTIPEEAKRIAVGWMDKRTGKLDFGYKFSYNNFSRYISRSLAKLAKSLGIEEKVIFYSARKSFAQYASEIGIPDGVIDYCLGHSDKSKGVIRYYTKVRQKQADFAILRVIDYVNDPEKYKDFIEFNQNILMMRG